MMLQPPEVEPVLVLQHSTDRELVKVMRSLESVATRSRGFTSRSVEDGAVAVLVRASVALSKDTASHFCEPECV